MSDKYQIAFQLQKFCDQYTANVNIHAFAVPISAGWRGVVTTTHIDKLSLRHFTNLNSKIDSKSCIFHINFVVFPIFLFSTSFSFASSKYLCHLSFRWGKKKNATLASEHKFVACKRSENTWARSCLRLLKTGNRKLNERNPKTLSICFV